MTATTRKTDAMTDTYTSKLADHLANLGVQLARMEALTGDLLDDCYSDIDTSYVPHHLCLTLVVGDTDKVVLVGDRLSDAGYEFRTMSANWRWRSSLVVPVPGAEITIGAER